MAHIRTSRRSANARSTTPRGEPAHSYGQVGRRRHLGLDATEPPDDVHLLDLSDRVEEVTPHPPRTHLRPRRLEMVSHARILPTPQALAATNSRGRSPDRLGTAYPEARSVRGSPK
jgi:hypothetical protein